VNASSDVVRLGVSACLLGQQVRYDGGHKRSPFLTDVLGPFVQWVAVCPEEEAGFGTPREAMRLERRRDGVHLMTVRSKVDVTAQLVEVAERRVLALAEMDLDGYVFKKDSPSCGLMRVKVYGPSGMADRDGRGLFAAAVAKAMPLLPTEEEGRLGDPHLRENFVERIFAYRRLRALVAGAPRVRDLMEFHARHKLLLLAHSPAAYAALGRLVADTRGRVSQRRLEEYAHAFMTALCAMATRGRHANVLQHMAGYFQRLIDDEARRELASSIADYQRGLVPLIVPVTLVRHHARAHKVQYLLDQVYLHPHPKELMLRNHV
jgi:uncharacterized protein YbgA (DUF1722 family)/uncharacterized protein YbbK (DUF523 family)